MRNFIIVAAVLTSFIPGVASAQCMNGQCSASAYGYWPASVYAVAPMPYMAFQAAYAAPQAIFRQYGGSGRVYETTGNPGQLTAWIAVNDPARATMPGPVPTSPTSPVAPGKPTNVADTCTCKCNCPDCVCGKVNGASASAVAPPAPLPPGPEPFREVISHGLRETIKVKIHTGRYDPGRLMQLLTDAGLTDVHLLYQEKGNPLTGLIEPSRVNSLKTLPGVIRVEVVK